MTNTLADLKRKLTIGQGIKLVAYAGMNPRGTDTNLPVNTANNLLGKVRYVVKVQTNGVYFSEDKTATRGSWMDFPKASLLEMDEKGFKVYESGKRELTETEKQIRANEPRDEKQEEIDALSDGSTMYYREKRYYEESGYYYLMGISKENGKRFISHRDRDYIEDDSIRGELSLAYEWVSA